jgi:hypothetical protein
VVKRKKVKKLVINRRIVYCHVKLGNAAELTYQKKKKKKKKKQKNGAEAFFFDTTKIK